MSQVEVFIDAERIAARVAELGAQIRADYGDKTILCVGVLKGSILFMSDLIRAIPGDVRCGFLGVSSYEGTESTGIVRITHDLRQPIEDCHVLVVEDIVDTGLTLEFLLQTLSVRKPASIKVASLLDKSARRKVDVPVDYVGFPIEDRFVVGYGLDLDEQYRNLPYVGLFKGA
ncbi:MAG: hypoxanthine phosphoribosyltransferase [Proteobacteria bacterium]|nr:hypoxanthine phosphoribosyltransferase [Pseudomonadota bacterium]